jgi:Gp37 protein
MGVMLDGPWAGTVFTPPTPIDITSIEDAIVGQLSANVSGIEIAHFPDNPESYRMTHRVGSALVRYAGAKYGELLETAAIIQERRLEFEITTLMRDLGWGVGSAPDGTSPGAYAILEAIRAALTGFIVPGCRKMYPLRERFVERDRQGGVWIYASNYALVTMAVEPSTTQNFPPFIKGIAMDEGGTTSVTVAASSFTADSNGNIALPNQNVFAVAVTAAGGITLQQGVDFTVDRVSGVISAVAGGALAAGETVQVAYSFAEVAIASQGQTAPSP